MLATENNQASILEDESGPFHLQSLLDNIDLTGDGSHATAFISCVEYWEGNLYIGSSTGEILHYVSIAQDPSAEESRTVFIEASRLHPEYSATSTTACGIQQILVLGSAGKVCVLCNGTLTFYSLPELSPAYGGSLKISKCAWVGGLNLGNQEQEISDDEEPVIMICLDDRIRLVKIGERPKAMRSLELRECTAIVRRGVIACAADLSSYSLLDVEEQQRIPLFEISATSSQKVEGGTNLNVASKDGDVGHDQQPVASKGFDESNASSTATGGDVEISSDTKITGTSAVGHVDQGMTFPPRNSSLSESSSFSKPLPRPPESTEMPSQQAQASSRGHHDGGGSIKSDQLRPHIVSPSQTEFLLVTGSSREEPGVGLFVNVEGDVVRGTIEFSRYPDALVIDRGNIRNTSLNSQDPDFVIAAMTQAASGMTCKGLEIQKSDQQTNDHNEKHWLRISVTKYPTEFQTLVDDADLVTVGLREAASPAELLIPELIDNLSLRPVHRLHTPQSGPIEPSEREKGEIEVVRQLGRNTARTLVWHNRNIWWAARTPLIKKLDVCLERARFTDLESVIGFVDRTSVEKLLAKIRDYEARSELEFLTLKYIRQKASLLFFMDLLRKTSANVSIYEKDRRITLESLIDGEVDPRAVLALLPVLRDEIHHGYAGIWLPGGLQTLVVGFLERQELPRSLGEGDAFSISIPSLTLSYLQFWRRRKGFGSISDERSVFYSVDAALLHTLLLMDNSDLPSASIERPIRAELNSMVDGDITCFDRAVELLESFKRLYLLSRLYHSRRMQSKVLETWRRILDGEPEEGGEHGDLEQRMRKYLRDIKDTALVEEYGAWLAARNPQIGVLVFADDRSKVIFKPRNALEILKTHAPSSVKYFLEHLVFNKNLSDYANDLIRYYLDSLITELGSSHDARQSLLSSYESYRALNPPKQTYAQFASENAIDASWWSYRLRLLQLLGGNHSAASQYDVSGVLERIEPYKVELVPEMIVLSGRQGRHREALHLLTHHLGDYDTAVNYCILGGTNTYSDISRPQFERVLPSRDEQAALFAELLGEFLEINDHDDRLAQSSELLERFAAWFDVSYVLASVPESWSVQMISPFLESAFRQLVTEHKESEIIRALTNAENLAASVKLIDKTRTLKPVVQEV